MKIGIIGGGFMGLALAHKLSANADSVTVFEQDSQIGGLATYHQYSNFFWDRFYHVILPGDRYLLELIRDLGLENQMKWKKTYTGVYVDKQFYSVSNNKEFLLFPPLNLVQKFRLALTIIYASRIKDWKRMESMTVESWLIQIGGRRTYEKFWKPLLLAKLGDSYKRVSAVFIWTYIKRLFEARDSSAHQEQMGYVQGGYKTVFDRMEATASQRGIHILKQTTVNAIRPNPDGPGVFVDFEGKQQLFDKVVFTAPDNVLQKVVHPDLFKTETKKQEVEYLGVICMIALTKVPVTPFYVLNIADEKIPFTGVIGMSTLVDIEETGGYYMTYFPKYVISTDPMLRATDEEIRHSFVKGLKLLYPELEDQAIVDIYINRAIKVQPLQVLNYSDLIPKTETLHSDFFILNTSQFVNDTLNNNAVARHVANFVDAYSNKIFSKKPIIQQ